MQLARYGSAIRPRDFGRGPRKLLAPVETVRSGLSDDLKLFATTFAAGFVFVSVFLG